MELDKEAQMKSGLKFQEIFGYIYKMFFSWMIPYIILIFFGRFVSPEISLILYAGILLMMWRKLLICMEKENKGLLCEIIF